MPWKHEIYIKMINWFPGQIFFICGLQVTVLYIALAIFQLKCQCNRGHSTTFYWQICSSMMYRPRSSWTAMQSTHKITPLSATMCRQGTFHSATIVPKPWCSMLLELGLSFCGLGLSVYAHVLACLWRLSYSLGIALWAFNYTYCNYENYKIYNLWHRQYQVTSTMPVLHF